MNGDPVTPLRAARAREEPCRCSACQAWLRAVADAVRNQRAERRIVQTERRKAA